jgi:hypothetical protein
VLASTTVALLAEAVVGATVLLAIFWLIYLLIRKEPRDRFVRVGFFIERERFDEDPDQVADRHESEL